jgi:hypothetical protein
MTRNAPAESFSKSSRGSLPMQQTVDFVSHISDDDLECYYLSGVNDEAALGFPGRASAMPSLRRAGRIHAGLCGCSSCRPGPCDPAVTAIPSPAFCWPHPSTLIAILSCAATPVLVFHCWELPDRRCRSARRSGSELKSASAGEDDCADAEGTASRNREGGLGVHLRSGAVQLGAGAETTG